MMVELPTVFDGRIKNMEGEMFHISLTDDKEPFCVTTPQAIPIVYCDKLKAQLDLLQWQQIVEPVTTPTAWCQPIVVAPKKDPSTIRMCVDLPRLCRVLSGNRQNQKVFSCTHTGIHI